MCELAAPLKYEGQLRQLAFLPRLLLRVDWLQLRFRSGELDLAEQCIAEEGQLREVLPIRSKTLGLVDGDGNAAELLFLTEDNFFLLPVE